MGAVLAEALITLSAVFLDPPVSALVACHVGVGLLLAGLAWRRRRNADAAVFLLLAIATAGTGPFGAVGMFAAIMADTRRPSEASAGEGAAGETAGEISKRLHNSIVAGRELSGRSAGLASFRDILAFGSFQDKQAALAIITRRFTPPLAPALRLALNDPDAAIRVQAATAAARIEDLFLGGLTQMSRAWPSIPTIPIAVWRSLCTCSDMWKQAYARRSAPRPIWNKPCRICARPWRWPPCAETSDWPSRKSNCAAATHGKPPCIWNL